VDSEPLLARAAHQPRHVLLVSLADGSVSGAVDRCPGSSSESPCKVEAIAASRDGSRLAVALGEPEHAAVVMAVASGKVVRSIDEYMPRSVAFDREGRALFVVCDSDHAVRRYGLGGDSSDSRRGDAVLMEALGARYSYQVLPHWEQDSSFWVVADNYDRGNSSHDLFLASASGGDADAAYALVSRRSLPGQHMRLTLVGNRVFDLSNDKQWHGVRRKQLAASPKRQCP